MSHASLPSFSLVLLPVVSSLHSVSSVIPNYCSIKNMCLYICVDEHTVAYLCRSEDNFLFLPTMSVLRIKLRSLGFTANPYLSSTPILFWFSFSQDLWCFHVFLCSFVSVCPLFMSLAHFQFEVLNHYFCTVCVNSRVCTCLLLVSCYFILFADVFRTKFKNWMSSRCNISFPGLFNL